MKTITKNIALFIITLGILSSPFSVHAATWVGPTTTPPGNNVSAPVNVGPVYQIKTGDLGVFSFFANYIKSLGTISANRYCFNNGAANGRDTACITSWPTGGTGTGIESIVAGTNVTVDNTDPLNPIVSSTATGGTSGVVVRKDGVPVLAPATTLNFTGSNITTTPSGNSVSIAVAPANPTALQKDGIQVSAAPLAVNFIGDNITATNTNGIVSVGVNKLTVQKDGVTIGSGSNFKGINFSFSDPLSGWDIQDNANGIAQVHYSGSTGNGTLASASPADKILRSDGTNWVQSPLVKHTTSSFQVNRPLADNSTTTLFQAAKEIDVGGIHTPTLGIFVNKDGNTLVNGVNFIHYGLFANPTTPLLSFSYDDVFQTSVGVGPSKAGIAVRSDGKVRISGPRKPYGGAYNAPTPLSPGLFLSSNDIFQVAGDLNGGKKGLAVDINGSTRVEGLLLVNGGQALFGSLTQNGDTQQTGNHSINGSLSVTSPYLSLEVNGNSEQNDGNYTLTNGNINQTGNYNLEGNINQTGNYNLSGNIAQTGNINTSGRWAVSDNISTAIPSVGIGVVGMPTTAPVIPYTFLSKVNGFYNGSLGLTRTGSTVVSGDLQVYGPATISGNLSVNGTIQTNSLANLGVTDLHVCVNQTGTLKICDVPLPEVQILNTSLVSNQFDITYNGNSISGFPTPSVSTSVTYQVKNSTSCSTSTDAGTTSGWNAPVVGAGSNDPAWDTITRNGILVQSFGVTSLKITCKNSIGNQASSTIAVTGKGTLYYMTPGTYSLTLPSSILGSAKAYVWGGGGGGGGSYLGSYQRNACGGGGAGGAGEYEIVNSITSGGSMVVVGGGGSGGNGFIDGNNSTGQAGSGQNGGTSTFSVNGNNMAIATGGYGGQGGGQTNGAEYGGPAGWSGGNPGMNGGSSNSVLLNNCNATGGIIPGSPFTTGWITGSTNIGFGGAGASVGGGATAQGAAGQKGGFILNW